LRNLVSAVAFVLALVSGPLWADPVVRQIVLHFK
jgi:hypothetical protein